MAFDPFGTIWHLLVPFGVFWNLGTFWYLLLVPSCYILDLSRSDTVPTSNFPQWKKECRLVIGLECKALCNKWVWLSLALLLWSEKYFLTTKMYSNDIPTTTRTSSRWQSGRGWRPQNFCIPTVALALVKTSVSCRVSTNEMRPFGDWTQQGKKKATENGLQLILAKRLQKRHNLWKWSQFWKCTQFWETYTIFND